MDTPAPQPVDAATIEAWCAAASAGNHDALERLIHQYHGRLLGVTRRKVGVDWQGKMEPEDVLQQAYVEIFSAIGKFTWAGEDSFYHWAVRILDHTFIDTVRHLRRAKRDVKRESSTGGAGDDRRQSLLDHVLKDSVTPSRVMRKEDAIAAMMACIARLPEDYRMVVQRVYLDQEAIKAVAEDMGRSEDAVRRLMGRAVTQLEGCLGRASRYLSLGS